MEKEPDKRKPPEPAGQNGSGLWGIGIYLCLAAALFCLVFASCTGGAVYHPKEPESPPTPLIGDTTSQPDAAAPEADEAASPSPEGQGAVTPGPETE